MRQNDAGGRGCNSQREHEASGCRSMFQTLQRFQPMGAHSDGLPIPHQRQRLQRVWRRISVVGHFKCGIGCKEDSKGP